MCDQGGSHCCEHMAANGLSNSGNPNWKTVPIDHASLWYFGHANVNSRHVSTMRKTVNVLKPAKLAMRFIVSRTSRVVTPNDTDSDDLESKSGGIYCEAKRNTEEIEARTAASFDAGLERSVAGGD